MPWMVALHIVFILFWTASLLALIGLLGHHHRHPQPDEADFLRAISRKLYFQVATPSAVLAVVTGFYLLFREGFEGGWLPVKLILVSLMVATHVYSSKLLTLYWQGRKHHGTGIYQAYGIFQTLMILGIFYLVTSKAF